MPVSGNAEPLVGMHVLLARVHMSTDRLVVSLKVEQPMWTAVSERTNYLVDTV